MYYKNQRQQNLQKKALKAMCELVFITWTEQTLTITSAMMTKLWTTSWL